MGEALSFSGGAVLVLVNICSDEGREVGAREGHPLSWDREGCKAGTRSPRSPRGRGHHRVTREQVNRSEKVRDVKRLGRDSLSARPLTLPAVRTVTVIMGPEPDSRTFSEGGGEVSGK